MADISRKTIRKSLKRKGFVFDAGSGDHDRYYFFHEGKKYKHITAWISRGSGFKSYGAPLWATMKQGLSLDTNQQTKELLLCPMDKDRYIALLREKEVL